MAAHHPNLPPVDGRQTLGSAPLQPAEGRRRASLACGLGLAALLALHSTAWSAAEVVTIDWGSHQRFDLQREVAPGQVLEVCGALMGGQGVQWQFTSSQPVAFNIHHHIGKQVFYAARRHQTRGLTQRFVPAEPNTYCWMWTAPRKEATKVVLTLRR
jgi:hypothetical protein